MFTKIFWFTGLSVICMGIARVLLWAAFGPSFTLSEFAAVMGMGARFDIKVVAIWLLVSFLGASLWSLMVGGVLCLPRLLKCAQHSEIKTRPALLRTLFTRATTHLFLVGLLLIVVSSFFHHAYVSYYQQIFSPLMFGFFDDDTVGILRSIWALFPVIPLLLGLLLGTLAISYLYYIGVARITPPKRHWSFGILFWSVAILTIMLFARGGLSLQPLNRQDAVVTSNRFLNSIVVNAPAALVDAWEDQRLTLNISHQTQLIRLHERGFNSIEEALQLVDPDPKLAWSSLIKHRSRKKPFVEEHPPQIVMGLMETWARHFIDLHKPGNNMMGAFEKHAKTDIFLPHFYSVHMGTHPSLEGNLFTTPITPLTMGKYGLHELTSLAIKPFKEKGYRTIFIYSGSNKWRALDRTLPHQGFDELYDIADIRQFDPQTKANFWGAYDEYMFRFMQHRLEIAEAKKEKVFIFFLTMTNHPPYSIPDDYHPLPIDQQWMSAHSKASPENVIGHAETFQYATHQLGVFLDHLKTRVYGQKTLVAVSGDHSVRDYFKLDPQADAEALLSTPAYFYVPSAYMAQQTRPDPQTYSSHQSLFPSMVELALSDSEYVAFGAPLFRPIEPHKNFGLADFSTLFSAEGAVFGINAHPSYFAWRGNSLIPDHTPPNSLKEKFDYARARTAIQEWWVQEQFLTHP